MGVELRGEPGGRRLNTWKEIASFFGRDERTVRRWEATRSLPVRRLPNGPRSSVFAYEGELRAWLDKGGTAEPMPTPPADAETLPVRSVGSGARYAAVLAAVALILIGVLAAQRFEMYSSPGPTALRTHVPAA